MALRNLIAERVRIMGSSGIRRAFDLAASLKDPINFSIGQPDFPVPANVKRAIARAVEEDRNGYTVTRGLPVLRERIKEGLAREFPGWEPDLFVTGGVSGGLLLSLFALLNPGDEVLFGDPYFVSYPHLVRLAGGVPIAVDLYDDFQLLPDRFAAAVTERTRAIILTSPGNPSGVVYRPNDVKAIAELARHRDLLIISDEIYGMLSYDGPSPNAVLFAPERTLILRGFGKSHAMTGLRIGYAAGPSELITAMAKLQQYTYVCAPHPIQYGAIEALGTDMSRHVSDYRAKRDLVCRELERAFQFIRPSGGFYVFPKVPPRFASGAAFIEEAVRRNLLLVAGEVFSRRDTHFRLSYAVPDDKIRAGCEILRSLAQA